MGPKPETYNLAQDFRLRPVYVEHKSRQNSGPERSIKEANKFLFYSTFGI